MSPHSCLHKLLTSAFALLLIFAPAITNAQENKELPAYITDEYGVPPEIPEGPLSEELAKAFTTVFVDAMESAQWGPDQAEALTILMQSNDPRLAWPLTDLLRFISEQELNTLLTAATSSLLGKSPIEQTGWHKLTDTLIAWDIPAPPNYLDAKRAIFTSVIPGWDKIFMEGDIDWRHVSWGGVLIDDRAYDTTDELCNCIPAADNPKVSTAKEATWLDDTDIVFGIAVNGEYRAYPRRILEVREMVNDTLGGRDLGIPYCTLCGAAQAYFTDELPDGIQRPVLRTSGLLIRSNKVMYDITSHSVFDTFRGNAVTGPLAAMNFKLKQASVVTTEWGAWKKAHPETTVLKEYLALGRDFDFRNNRDANGPIFPVGNVDPRLSVHEDIIGVITGSGKAIAFQRSKAQLLLSKGEEISFEDVQLKIEAGGIKAVDKNGNDLGSHQAFWFAWSQFYPETILWAEQG